MNLFSGTIKPIGPVKAVMGFHDELTAIRRDLHSYPELGFLETRTARRVAEDWEASPMGKLKGWISQPCVFRFLIVRGRNPRAVSSARPNTARDAGASSTSFDVPHALVLSRV